MAQKVLTYEEHAGTKVKTPEKVAAYINYLKNHPDAAKKWLEKKSN